MWVIIIFNVVNSWNPLNAYFLLQPNLYFHSAVCLHRYFCLIIFKLPQVLPDLNHYQLRNISGSNIPWRKRKFFALSLTILCSTWSQALCGVGNFEFIVSERVQVNPNNSRAMSALTFLLFKLNTLQTKIVKLWVSRSHGVMTVVYRIYTTAVTPR